MAWPERDVVVTIAVVFIFSIGILGAGFLFTYVFPPPTYVTVTLLGSRGLDADDEQARVEFDVAIGFLQLGKDMAVAHDGGNVTVSFAGVKLAEGPVPKFYVAGGPMLVEATRAVASAGKDQAPLPQTFRDHIWVQRQQDGEAEFDIHLSFLDLDVTTGEITRSYYNCTAGLALVGTADATSICGKTAASPVMDHS